MNQMPQWMRKTLREIQRDKQMGDGIAALLERGDVEQSKAMLAGAALNPMARKHMEGVFDAMWKKDAKVPPPPGREVVVGGGLHAAIYCAVRVATGHKPPVVFERYRPGGAFAISTSPAFYLNSRNRAGDLALPGIPGRQGALNLLPGALLQPADISASEYSRNDDLAYLIRMTLAMNAHTCMGAEVVGVSPGQTKGRRTREFVELRFPYGNRLVYTTPRIIVATGLGKPIDTGAFSSERIISFNTFMERFNSPFPLRGLGRVAVVGKGDSGKTVIEALTGQGPAEHMSVAALDSPQQIDWYGPGEEATCKVWEANNRSRYKRIGRLLPLTPSARATARVQPYGLSLTVYGGFDCAYVNERPYDHVVVCIGFRPDLNWLGPTVPAEYATKLNRPTGVRIPGREIYLIGPASNLPVDPTERASTEAFAVPENQTALFRYADRTASLAASLP